MLCRDLSFISTHNCKSPIFLIFSGPCIVSTFLLIYFQRDAISHSLFISGKLLYMFLVVSSPIIRSTYNCIYSIWHLLNITAICLYCGRVGAGLSVVWGLYRTATQVLTQYLRRRSVQFPHDTQNSSNSPTIEADSSNV